MRNLLLKALILLALLIVIGIAYVVLSQDSTNFNAADNAATAIASLDKNHEPLEEIGEYVSLNEVIEAAIAKLASTTKTTTEPKEIEENYIETQSEEAETASTPPPNLGDAIVKISCEQKTSKLSRKVSGTGFFIDKRGVIITNAHVAQFLLLRGVEGQGETKCSASTALENAPTYDIELLYISPTWLIKNASLITVSSPKGTGENDFALIYVKNKSEDGGFLSFPYLPPATSPLPKSLKDDTVILVGYPKSEENGNVNTRTVATTTVRGLYTFGSGFADIVSLEASSVGYVGASGGPVIDHLGRSIAMISTKSTGSTILNAITMTHVNLSIQKETGYDLVSALQGDLTQKAALFNEVISPILQEILAENL